MKNIFETTNQYRIFQVIIENDGISRAQLARKTGLNRSTISYIVNTLMDQNLIYESSIKVLTGGRASNLLYFNYNFHEIFLIDLQNQKIKIFITNLLGEQKALYDFPFDHQKINSFKELENTIATITKIHPNISYAGLSVHGTITSDLKQINSPFYDYNYEDITDLFIKYNLILIVENESNIQTVGIKKLYEPNATSLINIHIKDGIGAGQIINGHLHRGANGLAGEIGHSIAVYNGIKCSCGNSGCLEKYASETAIKQQFMVQFNLNITMDNICNALVNKEMRLLYDQALDLLAIKINDLLLFSNPNILYITSNIYGAIPSFEVDILKRLNSSNLQIPKIKVITENTDIFTYGFANLIFDQIFETPIID